jgi:hypothetical protein
MDVSLLLACDYANVTKDNKLNVLGIFSRLYMRQFPGKHAQMFLVMQLRALPAEYGRQFKLGVRLIDQDAIRHLVKIDANLRIPKLKGISRAEINHVMRLNNVEFPEAGPYDFSILIDNDIKASLPIEVLELPQRQLGNATPTPDPLTPNEPEEDDNANNSGYDGDFLV